MERNISGRMTVFDPDTEELRQEPVEIAQTVEDTPTEEDTALDLLADHEYRLCMLELGGEV